MFLKVMVLVLALNSCTVGGRYMSYGKPFSLNTTPPSGTPQFRLGWQHGCSSALSGVNTTASLMAQTHRYYIHGKLWNDGGRYKTGWKDGYNYCSYHMFTFLMNTL
jgi:hypothetical protein